MLRCKELLERDMDVEVRTLEDVNGSTQVIRIQGNGVGDEGRPVGLIYRRAPESWELNDDVWAIKCARHYMGNVCWYAKDGAEVRV